MDNRKISALNVGTSIVSRIIILLFSIVVRRLLIQYIGNEVNGLNSLYTSVIGTLSVAELGVGIAIVFSMYRPIVQGDKGKVAALYQLYKKLYRIIGLIIFLLGIIVMFFLPYLINDYELINENVYLTFFLTLVSVVLSYLYSANTSLIEAHMENYITTCILTAANIIRYGLQIVAIVVWKSYTAYVVCLIINTLIVWFLSSIAVRKRHGDVVLRHDSLDSETKKEIVKNIKAMFLHKIGSLLVFSIDNIIISAFIGAVVLGKYSNYSMVATTISGIISLIFSSLTSVVGHICAEGDVKKTNNYFNHFYCLNYILGFVFFLGYYAVIDSLVVICFGSGVKMARTVSLVISVNQFTQYMRKTPLLFRDASGTFYYDRWKPLAEGLFNLVLSLLLVKILPQEYRVTGVILATIITTLLICYTVEPYVVFKHIFNRSSLGFTIKNYGFTALFVSSLFIFDRFKFSTSNIYTTFLFNGLLSLVFSALAISLVSVLIPSFRREIIAWVKVVTKRNTI
ncbi:MAG: oligosaccharide flippase family protein [Sphaerochaetaceae bacterium]|nr:oligosaccharide flippase family protein [Sphaerochaetaceae bacterium]